jgi:hypothetical protein
MVDYLISLFDDNLGSLALEGFGCLTQDDGTILNRASYSRFKVISFFYITID